MAGVASVMCSYSAFAMLDSFSSPLLEMLTQLLDLINDTYACSNDRTINQLLKGEIGFRGYVMSDWGAQESTLDAIAGLDVRDVLSASSLRMLVFSA